MKNVLNKTENVRVEVDVSEITDNTILTVPVIISNGITKCYPARSVKATVVVEKQEEKTFQVYH